MSLITQAIRSYLLGKSAVTAVVGTRIFPDFMPQSNSTFPCIVMLQISQTPAHTLATGAGYSESRLQIDIYAAHASERDSLTEIVRNELQGFPVAGETAGLAGTVTSVVYINSRDLYEPPTANSDKGTFRNSTDYWARHLQAAPSFA